MRRLLLLVWLGHLLFSGLLCRAEGLKVRLDTQGPYVLLISSAARQHFRQTVAAARKLHPQARLLRLDPAHPEELLSALRAQQPRYAMLVMTPCEIDVNFVWRWLQVSTALDDDPLVDVRCGFISGATDRAACALLERTTAASQGQLIVPAAMVDNFGPNPQAAGDFFQESPFNGMIPVFSRGFRQRSISHGSGGFRRPESMRGAGLVHLGGHGTPDRIVDGLTALQLKPLKLSPCVVFNGACYTGVTSRWYEQAQVHVVAPADSFCLRLLEQPVLAYFAAMHADHGMPVYQEMEFLAVSGLSMGEVIKHTQDGVVLGFGGHLPSFPKLAHGPTAQWGPSQVMLYGTASRVLFGDPSLMVMRPLTGAPFQLSIQSQRDGLRVTVRLKNSDLTSTFTDTFHSDLAQPPAPFNARVLLKIELASGVAGFQPKIVRCHNGSIPIPCRLIGFALEKEGPKRFAHVQIDVAASGLFVSPLREPGTELEVRLSHQDQGSTMRRSLADRPKVSGWYISSALAGGTTKLPGVVARAK